jgi:hypothetical protein
MFLPLLFSVAVILSLCFLRHRKMYITAGILSFCFLASAAFCILNFKSQSKNVSVTVLKDSWLSKSIFIADGDENLYIELGGRKSGIKTVFLHGYSYLDGYVLNGVTEADYMKLESALTQINIKTIYLPSAESAEDDPMIHKIKVLAKDRGCDIINYNMAIYLNTGYSAVEVVRGENALSESVVVKVKRDGKTVSVYGGARTGNPYDYGRSDVAVILKGFENPYEVPCFERCVQGEAQAGDTAVTHNYSETGYVRVAIQDRAVEVSMDEP